MNYNQFRENTGQIAGDLYNDISGKTSAMKAEQEFNATEAQKARDFEERMSNTAYQRAVEDMKKAGLNPAAIYGQGGAGGPATTPSGKAASSGVSGNHGNIITAISSLMSSAAALKNADTELLKAVDMNKHMTEREKNYLENITGRNNYYSAKAIEATARTNSLNNKNKFRNFEERKYTKKDFNKVFDNLDDVEI